MSVSTSSNQGDGAPELVARVAAVMAGYGKPWCMCGGYAVDAWIGRETRDHGDLDVSVPVQDQRAIFEHLRGWQLIAHDFPTPGAQSRVEVPVATPVAKPAVVMVATLVLAEAQVTCAVTFWVVLSE